MGTEEGKVTRGQVLLLTFLVRVESVEIRLCEQTRRILFAAGVVPPLRKQISVVRERGVVRDINRERQAFSVEPRLSGRECV